MSVELERALDRLDTAVPEGNCVTIEHAPTLDEMGAKPVEPRNGLMFILPEIENGDQRSDDTWLGRL